MAMRLAWEEMVHQTRSIRVLRSPVGLLILSKLAVAVAASLTDHSQSS
jgi:hypothetical protein